MEFTAQQTTDAVDLILAAMKEASYAQDLARLPRALQAFPGKFTKEEQALAAIDIMKTPQEKYYRREDTEEVLRALASKFTAEQAQEAKKAVLTAIDQANSDFELLHYCLVIQALPITLNGEEARTLIETVLSRFLAATGYSTDNRADPRALGEVLKAVSTKVKDGQAQVAFNLVLAALKPSNSYVYDERAYVEPVAKALRALSEKLTTSEAQAATTSIVTAPSQLNDPFAPAVIWALSAKFTPGQAQDLANLILEINREERYPRQSYSGPR